MSFFTDKSQKSDVGDFHLFVTSHPYLVELGLSTFTTGTLFDWWNELNSQGLYVNRSSFSPSVTKQDLEDLDPEEIFGITTDTDLTWRGWKPSPDYPNAGVYKKQDLSDVGYGTGNKPWSYDSPDVGTVTWDDILWTGLDDIEKPVIGGTLDDNADFHRLTGSLPIAGGQEVFEKNTFDMIRPAYDVIQLNRLMASLEDFYPRGSWDATDPDIAGLNPTGVFASYEFLTEIKSSKAGPYIEWSGEMTFHINENQGTLICPISEWVKFKLYLYDDETRPSHGRATTIKNLSYVAPSKDVTGKTYGSSADGGHSSYNGDPTEQNASEIELSVNPGNGKWQSGSPTMLAVLTTDIGAATTPDVAFLETNDVGVTLEGENYAVEHFLSETGLAMPIRPQNRNPLQWQPNYAQPEDVRCQDDNVEKQVITVHNRNPNRNYERGETVLLHKVDNQWIVVDMGIKQTDTEGVQGDVGKWAEFSYLMTNSDSFFRRSNFDDAEFNPRDAEQSFHADYYAGDTLNDGVNYGTEGGYSPAQPFNTLPFSTTAGGNPIRMHHGFVQITSFDSLDSQIYGIRGKEADGIQYADKCSFSSSSATITSAGKAIPGPNVDYSARNAGFTQTFFGCVFPDGYLGIEDYLVEGDRGWEVQAVASGSLVDPSDYMDTVKLSPNATVNPFAPGDGFASRNNCRVPSFAGANADITEDNSNWYRYNNGADTNLFFLNTKDDTRFATLPADVMLNASDQGENGSPIRPVHRFKGFHSSETRFIAHEEAGRAFIKAAWLTKNTPGQDVDKSVSAFDFQPVNRSNIMFRPLKIEGYIQFALRAANSPKVTQLLKAESNEDRLVYSAEAHRTQLDNNRPITPYFENREFALDAAEEGVIGSYSNGLFWGGQVDNKPTYGNRHTNRYWDIDQSLNWTTQTGNGADGDWLGAGAFGVIATYNTVTALERINFITNNQYGMGADSSTFNAIEGQTQSKSWGVGNFIDSYKQENILDLSVRVYHEHPREQTLFDPRTFAVHHFNPGVRHANNQYLEDDGSFTTMDPVRDFTKELFDGTYNDAAGDPLIFYYNSPVEMFTLDFQQLSRFASHTNADLGTTHANGGPDDAYNSVIVPTGDYVFLDTTYDGAIQPGLTPTNLWQLDTSRTGKLLPFRYAVRTLKVPVAKDDELDLNDPAMSIAAPTLADKPATELVGILVVKDVGVDYSMGDTLGSTTLGYLFKVKAVDGNGGITLLTCVENGTNISQNASVNVDTVFNPDSDGPLNIRDIEVNGTGFDAYFVAPVVYEEIATDAKPTLMSRDGTEILRIAADVPNPPIPGDATTPEAEEASFVTQTREATWILNQSYLSPTNKYDTFFHFHNDCTMTWLASNDSFHGNSFNGSEAHEQFITVDISPA